MPNRLHFDHLFLRVKFSEKISMAVKIFWCRLFYLVLAVQDVMLDRFDKYRGGGNCCCCCQPPNFFPGYSPGFGYYFPNMMPGGQQPNNPPNGPPLNGMPFNPNGPGMPLPPNGNGPPSSMPTVSPKDRNSPPKNPGNDAEIVRGPPGNPKKDRSVESREKISKNSRRSSRKYTFVS